MNCLKKPCPNPLPDPARSLLRLCDVLLSLHPGRRILALKLLCSFFSAPDLGCPICQARCHPINVTATLMRAFREAGVPAADERGGEPPALTRDAGVSQHLIRLGPAGLRLADRALARFPDGGPGHVAGI